MLCWSLLNVIVFAENSGNMSRKGVENFKNNRLGQAWPAELCLYPA